MPIDYNLITGLGSAQNIGRSQALDIQNKQLAQQDYIAQQQAKANTGGSQAGFYQQQFEDQQYQEELQQTLPLIAYGIKAGDLKGLTAINDHLKQKYPDKYKVDISNFIPGQSLEFKTISSGAELMGKNPNLQGQLSPDGKYVQSSAVDSQGQVQITGIEPYTGSEGFSYTATAKANELSQAYFGGRLYNQLKPEEQQVVQSKIAEFEAVKAGQRITGASEAKMKTPLSSGDLQKYVNPVTLEKYPAGTTLEEVKASGGFSASPKQLEELTALDNTKEIVGTIDELTSRIIVAKNALEANVQGVDLFAGAKVKTNPVAAAYNDTRSEFTGILARSLGGEKGVLTDRDIERVVKGMPAFNDTKDIRDFKMGLIKNLLEVSIDAKKRIITGQPIGNSKERIKEMVDSLEGIEAPKSSEGLTVVEKRRSPDGRILVKYSDGSIGTE